MYNGILLRKKIAEFKKAGKNKVVILPYGEYGCWVERQMEYHEMSPLYCIDNRVFDGSHVFKADDCRYEDGDITYLIATEKTEVFSQLKEDLIRHGVREEQIESAQDGFDDVHRIMTSSDKAKVDFLCVGFPRCGTSNLNLLLKKNPHIFMPPIRENRIFTYFSKEAHELLQKEYETAKEYSCLGGSEPTYCDMPEEVYQYYGRDVKIIINLRNPMERIFTEFITETVRSTSRFGMLIYYKKYRKASSAFMDEWMREFASMSTYYRRLKKWLKYYPRNQVKIVVSEELVARPDQVMDGIQDFIGLKKAEKIEYDFCPPLCQHDGVVTSDYRCACINNLILNAWEAERDVMIRDRLQTIYEEVLKYTTSKLDFSMSDSTRQFLTELFREDIRKTEELIGQPLPYFKD